MHISQMCILIFFSLFTKMTSTKIQPSLHPNNINVNINVNRYVYGLYCSEADKKGVCACTKHKSPLCAGGINYGNDCTYRCAKMKALCNGSPSFPRAMRGECHYCSEGDKKNPCACPKNYSPVCAGGITYGNDCTYRCAKMKACRNGSPSFPRAMRGECNWCTGKRCGCSLLYKPVCAGGKTHGNLCWYKCAKKKAKCKGVTRYPNVSKNDAC